MEDAAGVLAGGGAVAFTGSGISAESGIPTFRDPGGIWDRFDPSEFGTWEGLVRLAVTRPDALADFLSELRRAFAAAEPGPAHVALARLEASGHLDAVVTQNVDGLHQAAGSSRVLELHGSFARIACIMCGHREDVGRGRLLADLDRAVVGLRSAFVPSLASLLPRCSRCGGPARPDFVAFGEAVHDYPEAERLVRGCRALLVVGTSGEVFPAAALPDEARGAGATVIDVSAEPTSVRADLRLEGSAGTVLPTLAELIVGR
ncbi:MAG: SIR2 family NAD-dependent protein deacylase [Actinomycetota bacterium]